MKRLTRIRMKRFLDYYGRLTWHIFCPECGHDAFADGSLSNAYPRAASMAMDHIPAGMACAFDPAYERWKRNPALLSLERAA